jgi:hypothetical protein
MIHCTKVVGISGSESILNYTLANQDKCRIIVELN